MDFCSLTAPHFRINKVYPATPTLYDLITFLVLMDINMPVMNDLHAIKAIKKFKPNLSIIAQTAYAISGDKEKSLEAGCDDYIAKPFIKEELLEKIDNCLNKN